MTLKEQTGSNSPEALQKARETWKLRRQWDEENVLDLRGDGLVPSAIADKLNLSLVRVSEILRRHGLEGPRFLEHTKQAGPRSSCPHCGR